MTKEEAINIVRNINQTDAEKEALEMLIPELTESEDERMRKELIEFLDEVWHLGRNTNFDRWGKEDCANWIAYLEKKKEQKPAEWNEEDLQHKSWILECLADGEKKMPEYAEDFRAAYKWLKSLRHSWMPSEEQMKSLKRAVNKLAKSDIEDSVMLSIMYDNLKKL